MTSFALVLPPLLSQHSMGSICYCIDCKVSTFTTYWKHITKIKKPVQQKSSYELISYFRTRVIFLIPQLTTEDRISRPFTRPIRFGLRIILMLKQLFCDRLLDSGPLSLLDVPYQIIILSGI